MRVETKPIRRGKERQRGSTLVEFTLTLLPLLALLMLTVDLAWVLFAWACIHEGVREGVRFAITKQSDANIISRVQQYSFGFVNNSSSIQISYFAPDNTPKNSNDPTGNNSGNIVKIVVSGISIGSMGPIWRSQSSLLLGAASADIVEPIDPTASPRPRF